MTEPDHIVVDSSELAAELRAILDRFGIEAVVRAIRTVVEDSAPGAPRGGAVLGTRPDE